MRGLCALSAIKSDGLMKATVIKFMEESRADITSRKLSRPITFLDGELAKSAQETSTGEITSRTNFPNRNGEVFREFLLRWDKLQSSLLLSGVAFTDAVNYYRAMSALKLQQPQLGILIGSVKARQEGLSLSELKMATVEMFETPFLEASSGILKIESTHWG